MTSQVPPRPTPSKLLLAFVRFLEWRWLIFIILLLSYTPTYDPGKEAPAGDNGTYRRAGDLAGPTSSFGEYKSTLDPGKEFPVS